MLAFAAYGFVVARERKAQYPSAAMSLVGSTTKGRLHEADQLSDSQKRLLTFCLLPSYIRREPLLTLKTGSEGLAAVQAMLAHDFGIDNRDALLEQIDYLLSGVRSTALDNQLLNPDERITALRTEIAHALQLSPESLANLESAYAWDLGEAAELTKLGAAARYLTTDELWNYLEQISDSAQRLGRDWYEYTLSYLVGRSMELGDFATIKELAYTIFHLPSSAVAKTPGLNAYTQYRFTINKDATGMCLDSKHCHC